MRWRLALAGAFSTRCAIIISRLSAMPSIVLRRASFLSSKTLPGSYIRRFFRSARHAENGASSEFPCPRSSAAEARCLALRGSGLLLGVLMRPLTLGRLFLRCGILAVILFVVVVIALKWAPSRFLSTGLAAT